MLQKILQMHYHLGEDQLLANILSIQECLQEISSSGYNIAVVSEYEKIIHQGKEAFFAEKNGISDYERISPYAQGEIKKFVEGTQPYLWLALFPTPQNALATSFTCGLVLSAPAHAASFMVTFAHLGAIADPLQASPLCEHLLMLFSSMWRHWPWLYAHSYDPHSTWPEPNENELAAGRCPLLYDINFLSQKLVQQIGWPRLRSAQPWKLDHSGQGGVLLVPAFPFQIEATAQGTSVAEQLGMSRFLSGRYLPSTQP